jgi:hypothetical protein
MDSASSPPNKDNNNIQFNLQDIVDESEEEWEENEFSNYATIFLENVREDVDILSVIHGYESTCNVKDIVKIGEYYGIQKQFSKLKKLEMIYLVVFFENDGKNADIVLKRKQMWFYIDELKQDKFMKRFVVW